MVFYDGAALFHCHHTAPDPPLPSAVTHVRQLRQSFLQGRKHRLQGELQGEGRDCPACCLQLFTCSQTSCRYFLYTGKPASKALGIWQYSAEGWLSHKSIQIQCLTGISPSRHCLSFCTLQQAAGDNCHPCIFLAVSFCFWAKKELTAVSYTEHLRKWMEKGIITRSWTGTSNSNLTIKGNSGPSCTSGPSGRQSQGRCWDNVPLCGDLSLSFFYTYRGAGGTAALHSLLATVCLYPPGARERTSPSS